MYLEHEIFPNVREWLISLFTAPTVVTPPIHDAHSIGLSDWSMALSAFVNVVTFLQRALAAFKDFRLPASM